MAVGILSLWRHFHRERETNLQKIIRQAVEQRKKDPTSRKRKTFDRKTKRAILRAWKEEGKPKSAP